MSPGISGDPLVELCKGLCRSTHFIVVDSFTDLHEEIVVGSAWAKERGEDRYLKSAKSWALARTKFRRRDLIEQTGSGTKGSELLF